jgi:hypothetical protein
VLSLQSLGTVNGQTRSFSPGVGNLIFLATFSDQSTALYKILFP